MPSQRQIRFSEVIRSIISDAFLKDDFFLSVPKQGRNRFLVRKRKKKKKSVKSTK